MGLCVILCVSVRKSFEKLDKNRPSIPVDSPKNFQKMT